MRESFRKYKVILFGLFLAVLFSITEFIMFLDHSFSHLDHELWLQIFSLSSILTFSLYIHYNIAKSGKVNQELREYGEKYRSAYNRSNLYKDIFNHDINNILQNILSSIELSKLYSNKENRNERFREISTIINEQIIRAKKLQSNIHKLSEIEDNKISLSKINCFFILKNTIARIKDNYSDKNLNIKLKESEEEYFVKANRFLINIFKNLLINSIQHNTNPTKEINIKVSKETKNETEFIKFEFIDNGIGIPDSMKINIFQRGYIKDKIQVSGIGLGLLLIKKILEGFKGSIKIKDKIEGDFSKGSDFIVLLPEAN